MIGAICAATTGAYVMSNHNLLACTGQSKGGIINSLSPLRQAAATQIPSPLPKVTNVLGPYDRMNSHDRDQVLAAQVYAISGHPFWARKIIQEQDSTPSYTMAL